MILTMHSEDPIDIYGIGLLDPSNDHLEYDTGGAPIPRLAGFAG